MNAQKSSRVTGLLLLMVALLALLSLWVKPLVAQDLAPDAGGEGHTVWQQDTTTSADGTRLAFYQRGERTRGTVPLVVISGGPGSNHRYMRVGGAMDALARDRQLVMFDQRGTGASGLAGDAPKLADWAADVEAIRRALGTDKIDLLGHSFGGMVAMAYMRDYSDHVRAVVFNNSTGATLSGTKSLLADVFPDRVKTWAQVRANLPKRFKASAIQVFTEMEFVDLERASTFVNAIADYTYNIEVNNALRQDMATLDFTETLQNTSAPVLVLHGRYDPVISPSTAFELAGLIPGARLHIMEGTSHLPFAEVPSRYADVVAGFLSR